MNCGAGFLQFWTGAPTSRQLEDELGEVQREVSTLRAKEAALSQENLKLKAQVVDQAQQNLLQGAHKPEAAGIPFSKSEAFALAAIVPIVGLLISDMIFISVAFNAIKFLQVAGLLTTAMMLLRLRSQRLSNEASSADRSEPRSPRSPRVSRRASSNPSSVTDMELEAIEAVRHRMRANPMPLLPEDDAMLDVQVLRFVREHGTGVNNIEKRYRAALAWRASNLPTIPERADGGWMCAAEMPNGEWATQYVAIALNAGYSLQGNPVKIERLGKFDCKGVGKEVAADPQARVRFNEFYLGLIEFLERQLDKASVERGGELVQTYEIFDLEGLAVSIFFNKMVLNFLNDVLIAFSTHYPQSFRKAVIINAPGWLPKLWRLVSAVLPQSVTAKVDILGTDYQHVLQKDLTPEALAWVETSGPQLCRAPHPRVSAKLQLMSAALT